MKSWAFFEKLIIFLLLSGLVTIGIVAWKKFGMRLDPEVKLIRQNCQQDADTLCRSARGPSDLRACLADHFMEIDQACQSFLEPCVPFFKSHCANRSRKEITKCLAALSPDVLSPECWLDTHACDQDAKRFCTPDESLRRCLSKHTKELSNACRTKMRIPAEPPQ